MVRILLFSGRSHRHWLVTLGLIFSSPFCFAADSTRVETCDTTKESVMCIIEDSTGYVWEIHRYKNGLKHGKWQYFNGHGEMIRQFLYRKDRRIWTFEYRDGEVIKSINKKGKVKLFKGCGC